MTVSESIAEIATTTALDSIPSEVRERIAIHVMDTLGVALVGASAPWNAPVFEYVRRESAPGVSSTCFGSERITPDAAALANATAAHGVELDDFHVPGGVHAGAVVVPAALAVAEHVDAPLERLLLACVLGYETTIRFGQALSPEMTADRAFHVTSAFGPMGAAVAAGVLRGLSAQQLAHAIGIAIASAGGVTEYTRTGGEVKRLHAGLAARAGVEAAALAQLGATAPTASIEGERGFLRAFAGSRVDRSTFDSFGERWSADGLGIKPWSTCAGNQPAIAAMQNLLQDGINADDIARIDVKADKTAVGHCGHIGPSPTDMNGLQFSMHAAVALRIVRGNNSLSDYIAVLRDGKDRARMVEIGSKVHIQVGAEQEAAFVTHPFATVSVTLHDGSTRTSDGSTPGDPTSPLDWAGLQDKLSHAAGIEGDTFDLVARDLLSGGTTTRAWNPWERLRS